MVALVDGIAHIRYDDKKSCPPPYVEWDSKTQALVCKYKGGSLNALVGMAGA